MPKPKTTPFKSTMKDDNIEYIATKGPPTRALDDQERKFMAALLALCLGTNKSNITIRVHGLIHAIPGFAASANLTMRDSAKRIGCSAQAVSEASKIFKEAFFNQPNQ